MTKKKKPENPTYERLLEIVKLAAREINDDRNYEMNGACQISEELDKALKPFIDPDAKVKEILKHIIGNMDAVTDDILEEVIETVRKHK